MEAAKRAFITGAAGQDGSYLAELLLAQGYEVHGLVRPPLRRHLGAIEPHRRSLHLWPGDVADTPRMARLLKLIQPQEIYHLAAVTFVSDTWAEPNGSYEIIARATLGLLDACRTECPQARFFQAGTSEMFGEPERAPQNETTPLRPRSPYGLAKQAAYHAVKFYREKHGLFAVTGIMFNHESPRRGPRFVTRKVTQGVARIRAGQERRLALGSLDAERDWGFAGDFVRAMQRMLAQKEPQDLVIGTGQLNSVQRLVEIAFAAAGLNWQDHVDVDPALCRPKEAVPLVADAALARFRIGWQPSLSFEAMIEEMVEHDLRLEGLGATRRFVKAA